MLGLPVAKELIRSGHDVTMFARDVDKMHKLFPANTITKGSVFDKESLLHALTGEEAVYLNLSITQTSGKNDLQPEREGVRNIVEAAKEKGIKRIVYLSSLVKNYQGMNGFNWWAFDIKQKAVDAIKASGINYTIFYPSTFMETFPYQLMRGTRIMMLGRSVAPMWFIAAEDYARQVARSFEIAANTNKEYIIQGPEPFTFDEAAKIMIESYKKGKLKTLRAPIGLVRLFGNFSNKINYGVHICEALNNYPEKFETEAAWNELGKPQISLKQYASSF